MKKSSKKGFSLIELIVVIAVIAAIAAVIVPQFGSMSNAAKRATDQRNVQLWSSTYSNAYAADPANTTITGLVTTNTSSCPNLNVTVAINGTNMAFKAASFALVSGGSVAFTTGTGYVFTPPSS